MLVKCSVHCFVGFIVVFCEMVDVDSELLITLVQARPVLWDKTLDIYKDRNATRNAWREVCLELKPDFDVIEDKEKNVFGKCIFNYIILLHNTDPQKIYL